MSAFGQRTSHIPRLLSAFDHHPQRTSGEIRRNGVTCANQQPLSGGGRELLPTDTIVPMPDAQQLVNISAPRGKSAAQCERQLFEAAINMIVAENSHHEKSFEANNHAGDRNLDDPVEPPWGGTR